MKIIPHIILFLFVISLLINCRKRYEEDPWTMKFINIAKRIEGEWIIQKILIDGIDSTSIIYDNNLKIFSKYFFSNYDSRYYGGSMKVQLDDDSYSYELLRYVFVGEKEKEFNTICFFAEGPKDIKDSLLVCNTLLSNNIIIPYSPFNIFCGDLLIFWTIKKLTKKEMHLFTLYNSKEYELFFKKMKK